VHLLRDMLRQRQGWNTNAFDAGEREKVGGLDRVRSPRDRIGEPDVDDELLSRSGSRGRGRP
jgi:hypothetical protein